MKDITMYSDDELSLIVLNTESWYNYREERRALIEMLEEVYIFTGEQEAVLIQDLNDDMCGE